MSVAVYIKKYYDSIRTWPRRTLPPCVDEDVCKLRFRVPDGAYTGLIGDIAVRHSPQLSDGFKIKNIALVGAVLDESRNLGPHDQQWLAASLELCRRLGVRIAPDYQARHINRHDGIDFLDKNHGIQADMCIICYIYNPHPKRGWHRHQPVRLKNKRNYDDFFMLTSPDHFTAGIWARAAIKTGAQVLVAYSRALPDIMDLRQDWKTEIDAKHFALGYGLAAEAIGARWSGDFQEHERIRSAKSASYSLITELFNRYAKKTDNWQNLSLPDRCDALVPMLRNLKRLDYIKFLCASAEHLDSWGENHFRAQVMCRQAAQAAPHLGG